MMQSKRIWIISFILTLILGVSPLAAQGEIPPEPTPTQEILTQVEEPAATPVPAPVETPQSKTGATLFEWLQFAIDNQLHWYVFAIIALLVAGNLVPKEELERRREQARRTETPVDDILFTILEVVQSLKGNGNSTPAPVPGGQQPSPIPALPRGIPINANYMLNQSGANGLRYNEQTIDGRRIAIPHGYGYRGHPEQNSPHCDIFYKFSAGFEFALAQKAGRFGYVFMLDNFVLGANQRFAIVVEYEANYSPMFGTDGNPTVYLDGNFSRQGRNVTPLKPQQVVSGPGEAQWVIETAEEYRNVEVVVSVYMPWASVADNGTLTIKQIKFVPVADDYGSDVVVRI